MKTSLRSSNCAKNIEVSEENAANSLLNEGCHPAMMYFKSFPRYFSFDFNNKLRNTHTFMIFVRLWDRVTMSILFESVLRILPDISV